MFLVIDIEATCYEQKKVKDKNEIIEFGVVACNDSGDFESAYQVFIKPVINPILSKFCRRLTGIKQDWINDALPLNETLPLMEAWYARFSSVPLRNTPWTSFGDWDYYCLRNDCRRHNLDMPFGRYIDLKRMQSERTGCMRCGLVESLKSEGMEFVGECHRAMNDATNASRLAKLHSSLILESGPSIDELRFASDDLARLRGSSPANEPNDYQA